VHLLFDIFQGLGIAAAVGIRPFLPALAVGALAAGDVEIHFKHTDYDFLQAAWFLLVLAALAIVLSLLERRVRDKVSPPPLAMAGAGLVLGALLFAGSLARGHYVAWPGLIGGVACATLGFAATQPLVNRVRARLESSTAQTLPLYLEGAALAVAVLSVVAPPLGLVGLLLLGWLLVGSRRRAEQKYAGLRILR
jgi:uncharacterized membrane protein YgdD (TMEM256/DUF423 family)